MPLGVRAPEPNVRLLCLVLMLAPDLLSASSPSQSTTQSVSQTLSNSGSSSVSASATVSPSATASTSATLSQSESQTESQSATRSQSKSVTSSTSQTPSYSATGSVTRTVTASPTQSPSLTASSTYTPSQSPSTTRTQSQTPSLSRTETQSPTVSSTSTQSPSRTRSPTQTPSVTTSQAQTPSVTPSETRSSTSSSSLTQTPSTSPTASCTQTASVTTTPSESPSASLTQTRSATETASATQSKSQSQTRSVSSSPSATLTASLTLTPTQSPTPSATGTPTVSGTASLTQSTTASFTSSSSATTSQSGTPSASATRSPSSSPSLTQTPSGSPTASLTQTKSSSATTSGTQSNSQSQTHTGSSTLTPTQSPTPSATGTPTLSGTASLTQSITASLTSSSTLTASQSGTRSASATRSSSPSASVTQSPSESCTASLTLTLSQTQSSSLTMTSSPTASRSQSATASSSHSATHTMSPSQTFSPSTTQSPSLTMTASQTQSTTPSDTQSRSESATGSPSSTPTQTSSHTRTQSATQSVTGTLTRSETDTPSQSPTLTTTASLTTSGSPSQSTSPSETASPSVTATGSVSVTASSSQQPSTSATPSASLLDCSARGLVTFHNFSSNASSCVIVGSDRGAESLATFALRVVLPTTLAACFLLAALVVGGLCMWRRCLANKGRYAAGEREPATGSPTTGTEREAGDSASRVPVASEGNGRNDFSSQVDTVVILGAADGSTGAAEQQARTSGPSSTPPRARSTGIVVSPLLLLGRPPPGVAIGLKDGDAALQSWRDDDERSSNGRCESSEVPVAPRTAPSTSVTGRYSEYADHEPEAPAMTHRVDPAEVHDGGVADEASVVNAAEHGGADAPLPEQRMSEDSESVVVAVRDGTTVDIAAAIASVESAASNLAMPVSEDNSQLGVAIKMHADDKAEAENAAPAPSPERVASPAASPEPPLLLPQPPVASPAPSPLTQRRAMAVLAAPRLAAVQDSGRARDFQVIAAAEAVLHRHLSLATLASAPPADVARRDHAAAHRSPDHSPPPPRRGFPGTTPRRAVAESHLDGQSAASPADSLALPRGGRGGGSIARALTNAKRTAAGSPDDGGVVPALASHTEADSDGLRRSQSLREAAPRAGALLSSRPFRGGGAGAASARELLGPPVGHHGRPELLRELQPQPLLMSSSPPSPYGLRLAHTAAVTLPAACGSPSPVRVGAAAAAAEGAPVAGAAAAAAPAAGGRGDVGFRVTPARGAAPVAGSAMHHESPTLQGTPDVPAAATGDSEAPAAAPTTTRSVRWADSSSPVASALAGRAAVVAQPPGYASLHRHR